MSAAIRTRFGWCAITPGGLFHFYLPWGHPKTLCLDREVSTYWQGVLDCQRDMHASHITLNGSNRYCHGCLFGVHYLSQKHLGAL